MTQRHVNAIPYDGIENLSRNQSGHFPRPREIRDATRLGTNGFASGR